MELTVLSSGSVGNCYLLKCQNETLILDCGISFREVKKSLNFNLSSIVGCFISHKHKDHNEYRKEYENAGIPMCVPYDTNPIRVNAKFGGFSIQAFKVPHGDCDNWGCLIKHDNGEKALYITDFAYTEYSFKACNINHFLIECNYQDEYVDLDAPNKDHKLNGHCSLNTCKRFIQANLTSAIRSVILIHLGVSTTNPTECIEAVKNVVPDNVIVDVARANTKYQLGEFKNERQDRNFV